MLNLNNTLDGYLKNVEVIGNTIQDTNNLANIRSVGDKVEGQELYKIPVVSCGKNIFDDSNLILNHYWTDSNTHTPYSNSYLSEKFYKVEPGRTYTTNIKQGSVQFMSYDKNKKFIERTNVGSLYTYTVPNNVAYLRFSVYNVGDDFKLQIEEGNKSTPYEPYKENKLEILSPVQLEKVGTVADRIVCKDGVWGVEKNINVLTLSGQEKILMYLGGRDNRKVTEVYQVENVNYSELGIIRNGDSSLERLISNKFTGKYYCWDSDIPNKMSFHPSLNTMYFSVDKTIDTVDKFREHISGTIIKFPTSHSQFIPLPHDQQVKLRTFAGQTNITFNTEIAGQIKAQVPKSLGATVNTHTEQIKDLHNSLDRVKKLEETTVSTVETESNFTTVDATSNGYFEGVKLEGKTLVNLMAGTKTHFNGNDIVVVNYNSNMVKPNTEYTVYLLDQNQNFKTDVFYGSSNMVTSIYRGDVTKPIKLVTKDTINIDAKGFYYYLKPEFAGDSSKAPSNLRVILLEGDHTNNPPSYFEGLMSVGQDVEEVSVESRNSDETQSNKKLLLYFNPTTETWEKPVLREWDSIEKHSDGKYYYHKRSGEVVLNGSAGEGWIKNVNLSTSNYTFMHLQGQKIKPTNSMTDFICDKLVVGDYSYASGECISKYASGTEVVVKVSASKLSTQDVAGFKSWLQANPIKVVYQLAQEEVYECTNIDLMTYSGETNYIINSGAISPKSLLKVHNNISNVVKILQEKVNLLENTFIAGLKSVLSGDMYSLATILYPEDFIQNDNTEQDIVVIPE